MASTTAVMGAGAWGTALAKLLADAGGEVTLWARRSDVAEEINCQPSEPRLPPGVQLPTGHPGHRRRGGSTQRGNDGAAGGAGPDDAEPTSNSGRVCSPTGATLVSAAKGIELGTLMRMSQVILYVTSVDPSQVAVISGPNLASEITDGQPAATVIACSDSGRAVAVQRMLNTGYFRPYTNADVIGTEIGGACKNVIALACGMAAGVGLGENTAAAIITRGLAEIMRFGIAVGAKGATLAGLAGVGDLVATCTSPRSRNRTFGELLGRGETLESALRAQRRPCRRRGDVVRVGAGAGLELRRRDAADRRGAPGLPQGVVRGPGGGSAAGAHHQAGMSVAAGATELTSS